MPKTIEFHNTPGLTREYVNNWLIHARKKKDGAGANRRIGRCIKID